MLFSAPSNTAVDNMTERLEMSGHKLVRLGHPVRLTEACRHLTLECSLRTQFDIVRDLEAKLNWDTYNYKRNVRKTELQEQFTQEKRKLDRQIASCLEGADVVLGTLITCGEGASDDTITDIKP